MTKPNRCYFIPPDSYDEHGYIPALATRDEPTYQRMTGNGAFASPWYWGKTWQEASACAVKANAEMGVSQEAASEILASALAAAAREQGWDEDAYEAWALEDDFLPTTRGEGQ